MKRKYPSEIIINKAKWQIVFTNTMEFKEDVIGLCQPNTRTIFIKKGLTERQTLATLIHEVLHALEVEYDIDIGHKIINKIECGIADIFRFNNLTPE